MTDERVPQVLLCLFVYQTLSGDAVSQAGQTVLEFRELTVVITTRLAR